MEGDGKNNQEQQTTNNLAGKVKNIEGKLLCKPNTGILKTQASNETQNLADLGFKSDENEKIDKSVEDVRLEPNPIPSFASVLKQQHAVPLQPGMDTAPSSGSKLNFRYVETESKQPGVDVVLTKESVRMVQDKLAYTLYGYFLGSRVAFPVVEYFAKSNWKKFGLQKIMMNANGFFFFKFCDEKGLNEVLKGGPWLIRNQPIFLNIWSPTVRLKKEEIKNVAVWVKLHDVPLAAYTEDGLSRIASKIGKPISLDTYTSSMCADVWGRSSYARALIEISATNELKKEISVGIPDREGDNYSIQTVQVEFEWQPPTCVHCCVFGHDIDGCPNQIITQPIVHPKAKTKDANMKSKVDEDGFIEVSKKNTGKSRFHVSKPKPKFEYRPLKKPIVEPAKKNPAIKNKASTSRDSTHNSFADLSDLDDDDSLSDDEEVIEELNDTQKFMASGTKSPKGASTPFTKAFYGKL